MPGHGVRSDLYFAAGRMGPARTVLQPMLLWRFPERHKLVDSDTDVCIEGYPRSANTFAYRAFQAANPEARVAHHLHTPIQVSRAAALGVPCAITVRRPLEAITSFLLFPWSGGSIGQAIARYADFHQRIIDLGRPVAVCRFEEVLDDPSVVARRLNATYGTTFRDEPMDVRERAELVATIERRQQNRGRDVVTFTVPRAEKDELKRELAPQVTRHPSLAHAEQIYDELLQDQTAPRKNSPTEPVDQ